MKGRSLAQIVLVSSLISLFYLLFTITTELNTFTSQPTSDTTVPYASRDQTMTQAAQIAAGTQFPGADSFFTITINWYIVLLIFALSTVIVLIPQKYVNGPQLIRYMNTQLQLANFETIGYLGKKWQIAPQVTMQIKGDRVIFTVPNLGKHEEFGLQINGDQLQTIVHINRVGIKLQVLRLYLQT